jgi:oxygen-independent coproporphyrinogen-3 oxidase
VPGEATRDGGPPFGDALGVYVHVPFCTTRCEYCAFSTWTGREHQIDAYVEALCVEIATARQRGELVSPATVFVGGGTPSLLSAAQFARIFAAIDITDTSEVTVECNPESTTSSLVRALGDLGVTRISLGVQSLQAHVLDGLGRRHGQTTVQEVAGLLAASPITHFSIDLLFGGCGETAADWSETLAGVLGLERPPCHISAYGLTVEPGTPLARTPARHPDDDLLADRYLYAEEVLTAAGFAWYEISNWARPGHECRHNLSCWAGGEYLGFGCAAHGHRAGRRVRNVASIDRYLAAIATGRSPVVQSTRLDASARRLESLELALRTRWGVPAEALPATEALAGLVTVRAGRAILTTRGRLLANEVAIRLESSSLGSSEQQL